MFIKKHALLNIILLQSLMGEIVIIIKCSVLKCDGNRIKYGIKYGPGSGQD